jgi:predicted PurR-regulated permease PerM
VTSGPQIIDAEVVSARKRHWVFVGVSAAIAVAVLVAAHEVLLPFVLALVIAYVLTPLVAWVESKKVPRALAIIIVYVVVLGTLGGFIRLAAPRVGHELANLRREVPAISATVRNEWVPAIQQRLRAVGFGAEEQPAVVEPTQTEPTPSIVARPRADGSFAIEINGPIEVRPTKNGGYLIDDERETRHRSFDIEHMVADAATKSMSYAQTNALELVKIGRDIVAGVSRVIFVFGITLMLAAYMMLTRERILGFFTSLVRPAQRSAFEELLARIDRGLAGVVRGQIIICLVNGALSAVGFALVGLKYWPVMALIATVLSLIPIFGSIVSSVPAVALGLTQSVGTAAFVLVWIIGIHQLEANLLNPKIMGDAAKIHPVLVIFSLLVGEHFFHTPGALLAVPCMSIAQSIWVHIRRRLHARDPELAGEPLPVSLAPPRQ